MSEHHPRNYVKIWAVLVVLLVISVLGPMAEIRILTLLTAFGIAFVKAYLVAKNFMHLDVEKPIALYIMVTCLVFMVLFFAGVAPDVMNHDGSNWTNQAAHTEVARGMGTKPDLDSVRARYAGSKNECSAWLTSHRTGAKYCSSPKIAVSPQELWHEEGTATEAAGPEEAVVAALPDGIDPAVYEAGKEIYGRVCQACHQANGAGLPGAFPPLAGAGGYYGDAQNFSKIIVQGLSGPIEVNGIAFNGAMPPGGGAVLSDDEIAAVGTYVRSSWGNNDGPVTAADVAVVR